MGKSRSEVYKNYEEIFKDHEKKCAEFFKILDGQSKAREEIFLDLKKDLIKGRKLVEDIQSQLIHEGKLSDGEKEKLSQNVQSIYKRYPQNRIVENVENLGDKPFTNEETLKVLRIKEIARRQSGRKLSKNDRDKLHAIEKEKKTERKTEAKVEKAEKKKDKFERDQRLIPGSSLFTGGTEGWEDSFSEKKPPKPTPKK